MDSLVDIDIINLTSSDVDVMSSMNGEIAQTHETDADLESYRLEFKELLSEVANLRNRKGEVASDIQLCKAFTERAQLFVSTVVPPPPPPKAKVSGSKWGILKSKILAEPERISAPTSSSNVHLPIQPEFTKFFYLAERLEMARKTSKYIGIRSKAPRAEYVEKCASLRKLILESTNTRAFELAEDIEVVREINKQAATSTLSILEHQPLLETSGDRPFDSLVRAPQPLSHLSDRVTSTNQPLPPPPVPPPPAAGALRAHSPTISPPPPPAQLQAQMKGGAAPPPPPPPKGRTSSVTFSLSTPAPPPPVASALPALVPGETSIKEAQTEDSEEEDSALKRVSVLRSFRSRSNTAKAELDKALVPELSSFQIKAAAIASKLIQPASVHLRAAKSSTVGDAACAAVSKNVVVGEEECAFNEYKEALHAHCEETLDSFHAEAEEKMRSCMQLCKEALQRRNGTLADMKEDPVFALHIAEALDRVQELRAQLQSMVRHQQRIREATKAEHDEMVQDASVTVVQQRVAFLTRIKEKLRAVHQQNQQKLKDGRKRALVGNATKAPEGAILAALNGIMR